MGPRQHWDILILSSKVWSCQFNNSQLLNVYSPRSRLAPLLMPCSAVIFWPQISLLSNPECALLTSTQRSRTQRSTGARRQNQRNKVGSRQDAKGQQTPQTHPGRCGDGGGGGRSEGSCFSISPCDSVSWDYWIFAVTQENLKIVIIHILKILVCHSSRKKQKSLVLGWIWAFTLKLQPKLPF